MAQMVPKKNEIICLLAVNRGWCLHFLPIFILVVFCFKCGVCVWFVFCGSSSLLSLFLFLSNPHTREREKERKRVEPKTHAKSINLFSIFHFSCGAHWIHNSKLNLFFSNLSSFELGELLLCARPSLSLSHTHFFGSCISISSSYRVVCFAVTFAKQHTHTKQLEHLANLIGFAMKRSYSCENSQFNARNQEKKFSFFPLCVCVCVLKAGIYSTVNNQITYTIFCVVQLLNEWSGLFIQLVCESIHSFVWNPARGSHLDYTCYEPCRRTHFSPSFKSPILHLSIGWRISNVYLNTSKCVCVCVYLFFLPSNCANQVDTWKHIRISHDVIECTIGTLILVQCTNIQMTNFIPEIKRFHANDWIGLHYPKFFALRNSLWSIPTNPPVRYIQN